MADVFGEQGLRRESSGPGEGLDAGFEAGEAGEAAREAAIDAGGEDGAGGGGCGGGTNGGEAAGPAGEGPLEDKKDDLEQQEGGGGTPEPVGFAGLEEKEGRGSHDERLDSDAAQPLLQERGQEQGHSLVADWQDEAAPDIEREAQPGVGEVKDEEAGEIGVEGATVEGEEGRRHLIDVGQGCEHDEKGDVDRGNEQAGAGVRHELRCNPSRGFAVGGRVSSLMRWRGWDVTISVFRLWGGDCLSDTEVMRVLRLSCLALLLFGTPSLFGWGREGHRLIAEIATRQLNAKAQAQIRTLLEGQTLESIASWADEVRPQRRETSTWHFIDLPLDEPRGEWSKYCPDTGCVLKMIPEMERRLANGNLAARDRAEALKFLVHFVGDMHQPLHVGEKHDRGGNDVKVVFFDKPSNLHSIWDTAILDVAEKRDSQLRKKLGRKPGFFERRRLAKGTLDDWAWQSRDVSRDVVYANLPAKRPAVLGDAYEAKAAPAVELQIRRAGVRLARVLNEALGR